MATFSADPFIESFLFWVGFAKKPTGQTTSIMGSLHGFLFCGQGFLLCSFCRWLCSMGKPTALNRDPHMIHLIIALFFSGVVSLHSGVEKSHMFRMVLQNGDLLRSPEEKKHAPLQHRLKASNEGDGDRRTGFSPHRLPPLHWAQAPQQTLQLEASGFRFAKTGFQKNIQ